MMQEYAAAWKSAPAAPAPSPSISMIAYRSRAVTQPTAADLERIVQQARERNRSEGVTGLLIYDQGSFFQWLEGPASGLARVWESINRDARHRDIEILREQTMPKRFFGDWDMRLAGRARGRIETTLVAVEAPQELLRQLRVEPSVLGKGAWDALFADVVLPRLALRHDQKFAPRPAATSLIWHAERGVAAELAGLALAVDAGGVTPYINTLVDQGATLEALFSEVFEPAARFLGGLWDEDRCREIELTLGLGRLQIEAHRLGASLLKEAYVMKPGHAVLVAAQPGEPHGLGTAMATELFLRQGWDVSCEFPSSDQVLGDLVHDHWFDVLDLSLSNALRRDQQIKAMGVTIRAARAASLNPAMAVIVDGRTFFERPQSHMDVHAHAGCVTVIQAVPAAERLIESLASGNSHRAARWETDPARGGDQTAAAAATSLRLFEKRFRSTVF